MQQDSLPSPRRPWSCGAVVLLLAAAATAQAYAQDPDRLPDPDEPRVATCVECHVDLAAAYERSVHFEAARLTGSPVCTTCHGAPSCSPELSGLSAGCADCHAADADDAAGLGVRRMRELRGRADRALAMLPDAPSLAGEQPVLKVVNSQLDHAKRIRTEIGLRAHRLDLDGVEQAVLRLEREVEATALFAHAELDAEPGFSAELVALILGGLVALGLLLSFLFGVVGVRVLRHVPGFRRARTPEPASWLPRGIDGWIALPWRLFRWMLTSKVGVLVFGAAGVALVAVGSKEGYRYWSSPGFCVQCHHMEEYYNSWARSSHNEVACVDCHFEPGLGKELRGKWVALKQLAATVTDSYSPAPYAEVRDASCLRSGCHSQEELAEPVTYSARNVRFDHSGHLGELRRGIKLTCTACHYQSVATTHLEVHESTCFLCHFGDSAGDVRDIGACTTCHDPPEDPRSAGRFEVVHRDILERGMSCTQCHVEVRSGTGKVNKARCLACHNHPDDLEVFSRPHEVHLHHVTLHSVHCNHCHDLISHSFEAGGHAAGGDNCGECHDEPHDLQARFFAGQGGRGVADRPDDMHTVGLDCVACHRSEGTGHDWRLGGVPSLTVCANCHDEDYTRVAREMIDGFADLEKHLADRLRAADAAVDDHHVNGNGLGQDVLRSLQTARHNLRLVERVRPVHNPRYAVDVLQAAGRDLGVVEEALGRPGPAERPLALRGDSCVVCHTHVLGDGQVHVHGPVEIGACTLCHADHTTGDKTRDAGAAWGACLACHDGFRHRADDPTSVHQPVRDDCGLCHLPHAGPEPHLLRGDRGRLCQECHEPMGDGHALAAARDGCSTCHVTHGSRGPKLLRQPVRELCLSCHDEDQHRADGSVVPAVAAELAEKAVLHGPIAVGDCTGCHDPHGSDQAHNLRRPYAEQVYAQGLEQFGLCLECHDPAVFVTEHTSTRTGFRNGDRNLHFVHVRDDQKQRSCRICHWTHAGDGERLMRQSISYGDWRLDIGFTTADNGGSCSPGCHEKRSYDRVRPVPYDPSNRLDRAMRSLPGPPGIRGERDE